MYLMPFLSVEVSRNCPIEGCKWGGSDFHLWVPNRRYVLSPEERMRVCEAKRARAAYFSGPGRPSFVYMVILNVSGATVVDGALPGFTVRWPPFSYIQNLEEVASIGSKNACGASVVVCRHLISQNTNKRKRRNPGNRGRVA